MTEEKWRKLLASLPSDYDDIVRAREQVMCERVIDNDPSLTQAERLAAKDEVRRILSER